MYTQLDIFNIKPEPEPQNTLASKSEDKKEKFKLDLGNFIGTENYYAWSSLYPRFYLTDGTKHVADQCKAYWLMDIIASYQPELLRKNETWQLWKLIVEKSKGTVICMDGNYNKLLQQKIQYTDFPIDEIELYAIYEDERLVILLPSEY